MAIDDNRPLRIALADDNPDLRRVMATMVERLGHRTVLTAADGAELIELCSAAEIDIVLADLDMPEVDGLEAAEDLSRRGIPVVLISGHQDVNQVVLEHEPIVACIRKPATLETLRQAVEQARRAAVHQADSISSPTQKLS
jgi:CheY-like chemotaxis protein